MSEPSTALLVPMPELETLVAGHRLRHDPTATLGVPAHVTLIAPFMPADRVDASVRNRLAAILSAREPFSVTFASLGRFARTLYLAPEPAGPFVELIRAVWSTFPAHPPYEGAYDAVTPHLTVGDVVEPVTVERLSAEIAPGLPASALASEAWLMGRDADGAWLTIAVLPFGTEGTDVQAPDGSPVPVYRRLPDFGEARLIHRSIAPGADILELGCGTGRITHRLLGYGHRVTAIDISAEMLAHVRGAETVHSRIEELELGRRFDCVLLASHLVNVASDEERRGFLATCARHLASDGTVLLQRYDPAWAADPAPSERVVGGVTVRVVQARREGPLLHGVVDYEADGRSWRHGPFTSRILSDAELEAALFDAGLVFERWLDERRMWARAATASSPPPDGHFRT